jgi:uncharacterized protein (UPF0332 family)
LHWNEFLSTAYRLASGATEGDWRSAVSRAYYAVFHRFREWLYRHGIDVGKGGSAHSSLYMGLNNCGELAVSDIADRIDNLRSDRVNADYEFTRTFDAVVAESAVLEADAIVNDFRALLLKTPTQQIADGAKNYLISIGRIRKTP